MIHWAELKRLSYVTENERFRTITRTLGLELPVDVTAADFPDYYRANVCDGAGWPLGFTVIDEGHVTEGIRVFSVSGRIQGRTTGSRTKCRSRKCPGWFVGVLWETGQQTYLCSEGWHFDPDRTRIDLVAGGEISARFVSPEPLGVQPAPVEEWPTREQLRRRRGWRITP